ncbi:MAG: response regulator [Polyangiaceae bacterium]|nr:response regulator [Polyangiaceae bacterium]
MDRFQMLGQVLQEEQRSQLEELVIDGLQDSLREVSLIFREALTADQGFEHSARVSTETLACCGSEYWNLVLRGASSDSLEAMRLPVADYLMGNELGLSVYQLALEQAAQLLRSKILELDLNSSQLSVSLSVLDSILSADAHCLSKTLTEVLSTRYQAQSRENEYLTTVLERIAEGRVRVDDSLAPPNSLSTSSAAARALQQLSGTLDRLQQVLRGAIHQPIPPQSMHDEIGEVFFLLSRRMNELSTLSKNVSQGDFRGEMTILGEDDQLAQSFIRMTNSLRDVVRQVDAVASGDYQEDIVPLSSKDQLGSSLQGMTPALRTVYEENRRRLSIINGVNELNDVMRQDAEVHELCCEVTKFLARYSGAIVGALYLKAEDNFVLQGSYALVEERLQQRAFRLGEGLVGQVAQDNCVLRLRAPDAKRLQVHSGLVVQEPQEVVAFPLALGARLVGVVELGYVHKLESAAQDFIALASENIAIAIERATNRQEAVRLLSESRALATELEGQRTEILTTNRQLEEQARQLEISEEQLQQQSLELETTNQALERQNSELERQSSVVDRKNLELQATQRTLEAQAAQLTLASRYKSEFLANMSHELRTPLNSMLLLAQHLADNGQGHLDEKEVESATIIHSSGQDLLSLINEILDLAKVEAGRMNAVPEPVSVERLIDNLRKGFLPLAKEKMLTLRCECETALTLQTDPGRLEQILRNLLSNAIKFTQTGTVSLKAFLRESEQRRVVFQVEDTGIGVSGKNQEVIFEAFQQVEGGIDRQHGGTGLGLSISRELAQLLGGTLSLVHSNRTGSLFELALPLELHQDKEQQDTTIARLDPPLSEQPRSGLRGEQPSQPEPIEDDRSNLSEDATLLIIEDDPKFLKIVQDLCRKQGFSTLVAQNGKEGVALANQYLPQGILLDLQLPDFDGLTVLDEFKNSTATRHIPVHIISVEEETLLAYRKGAVGYLQKPVTEGELAQALERLESTFGRTVKELLVVEDSEPMQVAIRTLLGNGDIRIAEAHTGADALQLLENQSFDCVILDLGLPDMDGFQLLKTLNGRLPSLPPIIVYTGRELSEDEALQLHQLAESIIVKGVRSEERLFDETSIFLHRMVKNLPEPKQRIIRRLRDADELLDGKKVLLVDDDMRSAFALSKLLTERGLLVTKAENGERAVKAVQQEDFDIILMDVMMPVLDGISAISQIRAFSHLKEVPIIALTAKAMSKDRENCLKAGANDYLTKPTDFNRLCSMMRVWLYR